MLPRANRLQKNRDVRKVLQRGSRLSGASMRLTTLPNRLHHPRFTVMISTKVAKRATVRNRLKRQARAAVAEFIKIHPTLASDIVLIIFRMPDTRTVISDCQQLLQRVITAPLRK